MLVGDVGSTAGGVGAGVAAVAALDALVYARRTVDIAREHLDATRQEATDARQAHLEESQARSDAVAAERELEVWRQFVGVVQSATSIADAMRRVNNGENLPVTTNIVKLRQRELDVALSLLRTLEGPSLPKCADLVGAPTNSEGDADAALLELKQAADEQVDGRLVRTHASRLRRADA